MFAYCNNNPIMLCDNSGYWPTWNETVRWLKEGFDKFVHSNLERDELTVLLRDIHYARNMFNNPPKTENEAKKQGYIQLPESESVFHQNNQVGGVNKKYLSPDAHMEAVYYADGTINDTPEDQGTYNFYYSHNKKAWLQRIVGHGVYDVLPYIIWGNSPDDTTTIIDRIFG